MIKGKMVIAKVKGDDINVYVDDHNLSTVDNFIFFQHRSSKVLFM